MTIKANKRIVAAVIMAVIICLGGSFEFTAVASGTGASVERKVAAKTSNGKRVANRGTGKSNKNSDKMSNKGNSFENPDFAYPKTVFENAEKEMQAASERGDYVNVLKGAIQKTVVKDMISDDNVGEMAQMFDSLGMVLPVPYKNMAYLIEGLIYNSYYSRHPWTFADRNLPLDSYPENVAEWSKDLFSLKMLDLAEKATEDMDALYGLQIKEIDPLLSWVIEFQPGIDKKLEHTYHDEIISCMPTIGDFTAGYAVELLSNFAGSGGKIIPFGINLQMAKKSISERIEDKIGVLNDECIERNSTPGHEAAYVTAMFRKLGRGDVLSRRKGILSLYDKMQETPQVHRVLSRIYDWSDFNSTANNDTQDADTIPFMQLMTDKKAYCDAAVKGLDKFPNALDAGDVEESVWNLKRAHIDIETVNTVMSKDSIKVDVEMNNVNDAYILVLKGNADEESGKRLRNILGKLKLVDVVDVTSSGSAPFSAKKNVEIASPGYGTYYFVPSSTRDKNGIDKDVLDSSVSPVTVTDMNIITSYVSREEGKSRFYVVDASTMKPIKGAVYELRDRTSVKSSRSVIKGKTDADGSAPMPEGNYQAIVTNGKDKVTCNLWLWEQSRIDEDIKITANVYTDLSIYKPGQEMQFAVIASMQKERRNKVLAGADLEVIVQNANWQPVDTLRLKTDEYGRVNGKVKLPEDGLAGSWYITVKSGKTTIGRGAFQVAEYKAPQFYVELKDYKGEAKAGDTIVLKGKAVTYSGMPVQGAAVKFNIKYNAGWFWWREEANNASYAGETTTSKDGTFEISLDTEGLRGTQYANGMFVMETSVTDGAGETELATTRFSLGKGLRIVADIPGDRKIDGDETAFDVRVENILGESLNKEVDYCIKGENGEKVVSKGTFTAPKLILDTRNMSSGRYSMEFVLAGDSSVKGVAKTILFRSTDKTTPVDTCLWVPEKRIVAKEGEKIVRVPVGNSIKQGYVLCEIYDTDRLISRKWIQPGGKMSDVNVDVPADNTRLFLTFRGMKDMNGAEARVEVAPYASTAKMNIETVSFRNRITPGETERWTFRFLNRDKIIDQAAVMAVMSNKSLSALAPFVWNVPGLWVNYNNNIRGEFELIPGLYTRDFWLDSYKNFPNVAFIAPEIDTYGYNLAGGYGMMRRNIMVRGTSASNNEMLLYDSAPAPMAAEYKQALAEPKLEAAVEVAEEEMVSDSGAGTAEGSNKEQGAGNLPVRGIEYPLAFFKPTMTVDESGIAELSFEVPNFNTTWDLKLVGWTKEMLSAVKNLESVSSKPVMVSMNVPRFLRTGDKSILKATLYNNVDSTAAVGGRIELFDPLTDKVFLSRDYAGETLEANGSRVIELPLDAPSDMAYIGIRAFAYGNNHKDGEQAEIVILPSSSPVIESTPFYIGAEKTYREVKLPEMPGNARVTLSFCNNPAWICLTALPSIALESNASVTSKITSLYGFAVANGLVAKMPDAKAAIREWMTTPGDSALMSPLEKNDDLKILALENTPWVINAQNESLRMLRLDRLIDTKSNERSINKLIDEIRALQNGDGGFSWCPGMRSSEWATGRVLLYFGMLRYFGYLPENADINRMIENAVGYCDRENLKFVKKCKEYPTSTMLNYYYIRTMTGVKETSEIKNDMAKCLNFVKKNWRQFGIYDAATSAMLLHRKDMDVDAQNILRSLSEKAMTSEDKGMWYDNLNSRYGGFNKLITTAQVLEAFAEITPSAKEVDMLRQWLILQKQAQEWGDNSYTAEVVNAILTTGSDWLNPASETVLKLNGREIQTSAKSRRIGEVTVDLNAEEASEGVLVIEKSGDHPAWGGVLAQFIQPSREVKAAKTEDIAIEKRILKINEKTGETILEATEVKPGDRVRVLLTITTTRDIEYVALTDERSACMAPVEQLSGYMGQDGVFYYREVKNSSTNLFIGYLPKGVSQIWYDCFIDREGEFTDGIATIQSLYAPTIVGHSAGGETTVK